MWTDGRNYNGKYDIFMYDLATSKETQITTSVYATQPVICGDKIAWQDLRNGNYDIYIYDLSTSKETRITTISGSVCRPAIYGNRIAWMSDTDGDGKYDISIYDLTTAKETQITTSELADSPKIYGDRVVWADTRRGNSQIYIYDISTGRETQITTASGDHYAPAIYGNKIL